MNYATDDEMERRALELASAGKMWKHVAADLGCSISHARTTALRSLRRLANTETEREMQAKLLSRFSGRA